MRKSPFRFGAGRAVFSLPRLSTYALAVVGAFAGTSARADYLFSDSAERGTVSFSGTSQGAFSLNPTLFAFRGATTSTDQAVYDAGVAAADPAQPYYFSSEPMPVTHVRIADGLIDRSAPVGTTISGSYPTGTGALGAPLIEVDFYAPDAAPDNSFVKGYLLDGATYLTYSFQTQTEGQVRYMVSIQGMNPVDAMAYSLSMSGVLTFGIDGANDTYSSSIALRSADNQLVITAKTSGVASAIPEPSAYGLALGLAAGVLGGVRRRRGASPRV